MSFQYYSEPPFFFSLWQLLAVVEAGCRGEGSPGASVEGQKRGRGKTRTQEGTC